MKRTWRTWALAGSFSLAAVSAPVGAQDAPPAGEPPVEAATPDSAEETRIRAKKAAEGEAAKAAVPGIPVPVAGPAIGVAPTVVGDYRVGHIHEGGLPHLFHYSTYNPYLDLLHQPFRQVALGGTHARYYAGYRNVYAPNWHEVYVPRYNAPACYGYDPYGSSYYGYGQTRSSFYGPNYYAPRTAATVTTPVPPAPPSGINPSGFRYTGDPGVYSPFGVGSSSYFGAYGSAGY